MTRTLLICLIIATLAGCLQAGEETPDSLADLGFEASGQPHAPLSADTLDWPNFTGQTLQILDHGAFDFAFGDAAARFNELTGAEVTHFAAADTGSALNTAILEKGRPSYDILYGVDNALLTRAIDEGVFEPYTPQLADRVAAEHRFGPPGEWVATPVDFGFIALNIDSDHGTLDGGNTTLTDLFDVRENADLFVTQDPRTSTPGLGFLLITIDVFGEGTAYDWQDYWNDLFEGGVLVTPDWSSAYERHFPQGYGIYTDGHIGDRPVVTSYTESPAVEVYFESFSAEERAHVLLDHRGAPATFKQIQTMGILAGTPDLALAQAWIEFTLTDDFQSLAAPASAVYPVVPAVDHDAVYGDLDPQPGTFGTVDLTWRKIGQGLPGWLADWTDLCEAHGCA